MTNVDVNRTIGRLRRDGLSDWHGKVPTVLGPQRLKEVAGFLADYLHLTRAEGRNPEVTDRAGDLVAVNEIIGFRRAWREQAFGQNIQIDLNLNVIID